MEKIDIHNSDKEFERSLGKMREQLSKKNSSLIEMYLEASAIGKTQKQRKQAGIRVRIRNLYLLKTLTLYFKKDLNKLTENDIEGLIKSLNEDKIKKLNGEKYSEQVKSNMKIVLISFLRYIYGETPKYHKMTNWIDTSYKKKEVVELSEEEVKKILNKCTTPRQKALIALLFDSGARIEELLNIRIGDVIEVKDSVPYYRVRIREEFSKTQGRTVSLLWKQTTPIMREWLEEHPEKEKNASPLIPATYDGVRKVLAKIGKRALNRSVNPHLFRHSSATYYASRGFDYFQLCKRFGWAIGSDVPNKYIHKSGIKEKEVVEKFKRESFEDIEKEIDTMREENKLKNERLEQQQKEIETLKKHFDNYLNILEDLKNDEGQKVAMFVNPKK